MRGENNKIENKKSVEKINKIQQMVLWKDQWSIKLKKKGDTLLLSRIIKIP